MKIWLLNVSVTILVTTITGLILSKGKTATFVKCLFSVLTLLIIVKPIVNLKSGDFNMKNFIYQDNILIENDFIEYAFNNQNALKEEQIKERLYTLGIENAEIEIFYEIENDYDISYKKIHVNLKNAVIKGDKEHIVIIEDIKSCIAQFLLVDKDILVIYE